MSTVEMPDPSASFAEQIRVARDNVKRTKVQHEYAKGMLRALQLACEHESVERYTVMGDPTAKCKLCGHILY